jgi:hypothetical protein
MSDAVLDYLSAHGPSLTSDVAQFLVDNHGLKPDAARQRVSRTRTAVKRLAYITFPRKARFIYLQQQYGSPQYWEKLVEALIRTRSAYGLAIESILQRGGLIPVKHFAIACGAPMMQARHLSPDTIFNRLKQAQLLDKVLVSGIGECIVFSQYEGRYEFLAQDVRARLITESVLLKAISDWSRKLGLVSYEKVSTRDGETLPRVGTFAWDLTAPSYLSFLTKGDDGKQKPGFLACDILLGEEVGVGGIRPFLQKCHSLRALRNVGPTIQMFVADSYSHDAFMLAKQNGIIAATPGNLFGDEIAAGLKELTSVLRQAATSAIDPARFDELFSKLGKIEGASTQLRGTLFEYLAADIVRKTISWDIKMNRIFKDDANKKQAEVDVVAINGNASIYLFECKGYSPYGEIPDSEFKRWLQHNVPTAFSAIKNHPDWKNLKVHFEFWATGSLSAEALEMFDVAKKTVKPSRYTLGLKLAPAILAMCKETNDKGLTTAFQKHYMKA